MNNNQVADSSVSTGYNPHVMCQHCLINPYTHTFKFQYAYRHLCDNCMTMLIHFFEEAKLVPNDSGQQKDKHTKVSDLKLKDSDAKTKVSSESPTGVTPRKETKL